MDQRRILAVVITVLVVVMLLALVIASWTSIWWVVPLVLMAICLLALGLVPRTMQAEVTGEDKYHLHPQERAPAVPHRTSAEGFFPWSDI